MLIYQLFGCSAVIGIRKIDLHELIEQVNIPVKRFGDVIIACVPAGGAAESTDKAPVLERL